MKRGSEKNIKELLGSFVQQKKIKQGYDLVNIRVFWEERMGPMINKYTDSITLYDTLVVVKINSSSLKQELSYNQTKILQILQTEFGIERIQTLQIR